MAVVDLQDLKDELDITSDAHDYELLDMIDAAEAEYAEHVRPLPGTYTESLVLPTILPRGTTSASVTGVTTTLARSGLLSGYGYTFGPVDVTYVVGPIPANHMAAIVADLAEWWTRTQRGGGSSRPSFGGDAAFEPETPARPVVMWPRIRALAVGGIA